MYKVVFVIDAQVDPTVYNFKDITKGNEFFTYITNDFHPESNMNEIIKDFNTACDQNGIKVLANHPIHIDHIAKEYR